MIAPKATAEAHNLISTPNGKADIQSRLRVLKPGQIQLPSSHNYIGAFLTFRCPFACSYCINRHNNGLRGRTEIPGYQWIDFFSRLDPGNVPVTLQGGEPGAHPDFVEIVRETSKMHSVDILTNLAFDLRDFVRKVDPSRLNREAPYAPIRVSYHPEQFGLVDIIERIQLLELEGFRVGLYGVMHPTQITQMNHARAVCEDLGIDFRTKPFLGWADGQLHGEFAYPDACSQESGRDCRCAPSELLIAPDGQVHACHHHLYSQTDARGHISDRELTIPEGFSTCHHYGQCNPCDVKVKNNRYQQFGHVSVRIKT